MGLGSEAAPHLEVRLSRGSCLSSSLVTAADVRGLHCWPWRESRGGQEPSSGRLPFPRAEAFQAAPLLLAWVQKIVPVVLRSFSDPDSRVRYYACEALYNIAKVLPSIPRLAPELGLWCPLAGPFRGSVLRRHGRAGWA